MPFPRIWIFKVQKNLIHLFFRVGGSMYFFSFFFGLVSSSKKTKLQGSLVDAGWNNMSYCTLCHGFFERNIWWSDYLQGKPNSVAIKESLLESIGLLVLGICSSPSSQTKAETIKEVQMIVKKVARTCKTEMIQQSAMNIVKWAKKCIENDGSNFESSL